MASAPSTSAPGAEAPVTGGGDKPLPTMTRAAVASSERVLIIIANKVYDVTDYAEDHPGGEDVMLEHQGADATTEFQDVGHSRAAQQELARYLVAKLEAGDCA